MICLRVSAATSKAPVVLCKENDSRRVISRGSSVHLPRFSDEARHCQYVSTRLPVQKVREQRLKSTFTTAEGHNFKLQMKTQAARWQHRNLRIVSEGANFDKVIGTVVRTGREGIVSATKLVPDSVPRPAATAGVVVAGFLVFSLILKALFNTFLTLVVVGGLGYGAFVYLTRSDDDSGKGGSGPSSSKPSDDPLDEARRIMDKYK